MTTPTRWTAIVAAGLLATLTACGGSDPGPSGAPPAVGNSSSPHTEEEAAKDTSAAKEFCNRYNEYMGDMMQGGDAAKAALPKLDQLIDTAPAEFREWTPDFSPWVKAQVSDDTAALNAAAEASEEAGYQISNKCQFVLADM